LSFLLNLLDGVLENPGRIVIMTSNHPDMLDTALIRPGRIDVIAKFRNCSNKTIIEMIEFFYDINLSKEEKTNIYKLKKEIITPAELSKIMFENFSNYTLSISHITSLSEKIVLAETLGSVLTTESVSLPLDPQASEANQNLDSMSNELKSEVVDEAFDNTPRLLTTDLARVRSTQLLNHRMREPTENTTMNTEIIDDSNTEDSNEQKGNDIPNTSLHKGSEATSGVRLAPIDNPKVFSVEFYSCNKKNIAFFFRKYILPKYVSNNAVDVLEKRKIVIDNFFENLIHHHFGTDEDYIYLQQQLVKKFVSVIHASYKSYNIILDKARSDKDVKTVMLLEAYKTTVCLFFTEIRIQRMNLRKLLSNDVLELKGHAPSDYSNYHIIMGGSSLGGSSYSDDNSSLGSYTY